MQAPMLHCDDERRRMRHQGRECAFNGIEYVEVLPKSAEQNVHLIVHFQDDLTGDFLISDWRVDGGRRSLPVTRVEEFAKNQVKLTIDCGSDESTGRLTLLHPDRFQVDPHFASFDFRFPGKPGSDLDDLDESTSPVRQSPTPQIDYLARDYGRLKRLLFDRLSVTIPDWKERHIPDLGVMLVELFAYIGDHLSYQQDAIATEAYLGTARQRISVRRHARLVDYRLHEGCNSRGFLHIQAPGGDELDPDDVVFIAGLPPGDIDPPEAVSLTELDSQQAQPLVYFEAVQPPEKSCFFNSIDLKNFMELIRQMANATEGCLSELWKSFPSPLTVAILTAIYSPPDSCEELTAQVTAGLNDSLRELRLSDRLSAEERKRCSEATLGRAATQCPHACPATTNRAILEDLFPQLIVRRVTSGDKIRLDAAHNEIEFYTWDGSRCWLPRGTTSATLKDRYLPASAADLPNPRALDNLQVGDLLLLEEVLGSRTGNPEDANPDHRQIVRLTRVTWRKDSVVQVPLPGKADNEGNPLQDGLPLVEIEWHPDDALTFPLCLSARGRATSDCHLIEKVSVARGNMVLVDQGRTFSGEPLADQDCERHSDPCADPNCCGTCSSESPPKIAPRPYRPELKRPDLTFSQPLRLPERDKAALRPMAASAMLIQLEHKAEPQLKLRGITPSPNLPLSELCVNDFSLDKLLQQLRVAPLDLCQKVAHLLPGKRCHEVAAVSAWTPRNELEQGLLQRLKDDLEKAISWVGKIDLIDTLPEAREFTIEVDENRRTHLRFPESGPNQPIPGSKFWATYRQGNGLVGNVGAGGITHIGFRKQDLTGRGLRVRNPLPSVGGRDPETIASARMLAPTVTRKLKRAITEDDYRAVVLQEFPNEVQGARAQLIPGPLGQFVRLAIDPFDRVDDIDGLLQEIKRSLKPFVRIGHDLTVALATLVPIHLKMVIGVVPGYYFEHIKAELLRVFSAGTQSNGKLGFFHPDLRTFGQGVFLSEVIAAARKVVGVRSVEVKTLQRIDQPDQSAIESGVLALAPLEVAVLNRSRAGHGGKLEITNSESREGQS